jgi:hypothetical protein
MTSTAVRWTSADLATFPNDGKRREIIDGALYVSKQPNWYHQAVCMRIGGAGCLEPADERRDGGGRPRSDLR